MAYFSHERWVLRGREKSIYYWDYLIKRNRLNLTFPTSFSNHCIVFIMQFWLYIQWNHLVAIGDSSSGSRSGWKTPVGLSAVYHGRNSLQWLKLEPFQDCNKGWHAWDKKGASCFQGCPFFSLTKIAGHLLLALPSRCTSKKAKRSG